MQHAGVYSSFGRMQGSSAAVGSRSGESRVSTHNLDRAPGGDYIFEIWHVIFGFFTGYQSLPFSIEYLPISKFTGAFCQFMSRFEATRRDVVLGYIFLLRPNLVK